VLVHGSRILLAKKYKAFISCLFLFCNIILPAFFHVFMSLKNNGNIVFIADSLMAVFFLVLLTDWRNTLAMFITGTTLGALLYFFTTPNPTIPKDYIERIPTFLVIIIGGSLFKFSEKQLETEKLQVKTTLAGSIAHEMRNPLGQIKYSLDSIEHALPTAQHSLGSIRQLPAQKLNTLYQLFSPGTTCN
jgi:signal transduction histidine kinase